MDTSRRRCRPLAFFSSLFKALRRSFIESPTLFKIYEVMTFEGVQQSFHDLREDYTFVQSWFLLLILPSASGILRRIQDNVLNSSDKDINEVKKSFVKDFDMLAVAGAILAQVAMTALDLKDLNSTHWTATGAFTVALVTGALTVVHSCLLQQRINGFFSAKDLRNWLSRHPADVPNHDSEAGLNTHKRTSGGASISAIFIINVPAMLLYYSVVSFLVGLAIYVVSSWSGSLDNFASQADAFRVMILYIATASSGMLVFFVPVVLKMLESSEDRRKRYIKEHHGSSQSSEMTTMPSSGLYYSSRSLESGNRETARSGSFRDDSKDRARRQTLNTSLDSTPASAADGITCSCSAKMLGLRPMDAQQESFPDRLRSIERAIGALLIAQEQGTAASRALLAEFQISGDDRMARSSDDSSHA